MLAARIAIRPSFFLKRGVFNGWRGEKQMVSPVCVSERDAQLIAVARGGMKHIKEFDGLRGLLALWVFVAHTVEHGPYWAATRFIHANWAVDIFIILSGFVIFHLLSSGEDYRSFLTRRWFRLFPVFAVCFLVALALYAGLRIDDELAFGIGAQTNLSPHLVTHATMLHGVVPNEVLPRSAQAILPPAWSISVEWQFYLLAPLLFLFATRWSWQGALVMALLLALRVLHDLGQLGLLWPGLPRALTFDMNAFLPLKLEFFAMGAGCYALWRWLCNQTKLQIPIWCYAVWLGGVVLAGRTSPAISLWLIVFAFIIRSNFSTPSKVARGATALLNVRAAQFLGRISYPVYLLHLPVIVLVRQLIRANLPQLSPLQFECILVIASLALTIGGAWLLHVSVEHPMIQFGKRLTRTWKTRLPESASTSAATNG